MTTDELFTIVRAYGWHNSTKYECVVCHTRGYGPIEGKFRSPWVETHLRGHSPCPWCGRQQTLRKDGTPRVHSRCKERPDDVELLRLIAAEVKHDARLGVRGPMTQAATHILDRLGPRGDG